MSGNSTKSNKIPNDDVNNSNICKYDDIKFLCKNSRPPKCDCGKPMESHFYELRSNIANTAFLLTPAWYEEVNKKRKICDICQKEVGEVLWVCPDQTCMMKNKSGKDQLLLICTKCIRVNGIIHCALCEEEVYVDYSLPCTECKYPLCWKCHHNWSLKCPKSKERDTSDITCPFCRSNIKQLFVKNPEKNYRREDTADGQSSTTEKEKYETPKKSGNVDELVRALRQSMGELD